MEKYFLNSNEDSKKLYKNISNQTTDAIIETFIDSKAYSGPTPQQLKSIINQNSILPDNGLGWEKVLDITKQKILPNLLRTPSTDYMAHLHGPSLLETIAAEQIISTFNQSMDSWDQSPVATEIEEEVTKHLCKLYGFDNNSDGIFTSGGSQSNQTAIILARDWFCNHILNHDVKKYGLPTNFTKLKMYTSEISHFSMEKSAHVLGLGYECVRKVPVDEKKKMNITKLQEMIAEDKANGNIPFLIVATIGTTDFGSIDDINSLYKIANDNNLWLHADAAYGSGVIMSDKYRYKVENLKLCDSITVDFHKMFLMTISCSCVLIKNKDAFDALTIHADYLNREEDEEDGYTNLVDKSLQTTRRFDGLKVWMSFQCRGKDGWNKIINTSIENAKYLFTKLKNDNDFFVVTEPEISSVVFRYTKDGLNCDDINKKIRRELIHKYGIIIGQTISDNKVCLKFTLLNPDITTKKLDDLIELIRTLAEKN